MKKGDIIVGKNRAYPEGALTVDEVKPDGSIVAFPVGGGFQMTFRREGVQKHEFRVVSEDEMKAAPMMLSRFRIDCWEDEVFPGYWAGDRWNGWATPVFEFAAAKRIMDLLNKDEPGRASYDEKTDRFTIQDQNGDGPEVIGADDLALPGMTVRVYSIGTCNWTWEEVQ